jgi:hypothetical protein
MLCDWESVFWGSSLFPVGNRELRKIGPRGNTGGDVRTIAGPWESLRVLEARIEASSSTFLLKVDESPQLWPEKSTRTGIPLVIHDQVARSPSRQVAKSPSRRHSARERSCARIGRGSPGRRCLLRASANQQHTPRADYQKFGADSMGGGDFSLGYAFLINLYFS